MSLTQINLLISVGLHIQLCNVPAQVAVELGLKNHNKTKPLKQSKIMKNK